MIAERPKAFIPTEDQGYLIVVGPDARRHQRRGDRRGSSSASRRSAGSARGSSTRVALEGLNVITSTNQTNCGRRLRARWRSGRAEDAGAAGAGAGAEAPGRRSPRRSATPWCMVFQPPPIRGLSQTGGFELMIEDRAGKGVEALPAGRRPVPGRGPQAARAGRGLLDLLGPGARSSSSTSTGPRPDGSTCRSPTSSPCSRRISAAYYVNDFDLYGKVWKVMVQAEGGVRTKPEDIQNLYVLNRQGNRVPLSSLGEVRYALGPIDVPHYNLYASAKINGGPAPGYSSGQALAAMEEVAAKVLPEGFGYRVDRDDASRSRRPATRPPTSSRSRSSASSCSWRPSTRAGSGRWSSS